MFWVKSLALDGHQVALLKGVRSCAVRAIDMAFLNECDLS